LPNGGDENVTSMGQGKTIERILGPTRKEYLWEEKGKSIHVWFRHNLPSAANVGLEKRIV